MIKSKAIFLDRDGIINIDKKYLYKIEECQFVDGIFDFCKAMINLNFKLIIVTNQAGIARDYYTESDLEKLHDYIKNVFYKHGIEFAGIYHCPHHPNITGVCRCRKPAPGMLLDASLDYNLILEECYMIGDKLSDAYAGKNANVKESMLLKGAYEICNDEFIVFNSLKEIELYIRSKEDY